jgi:hypothetical protein
MVDDMSSSNIIKLVDLIELLELDVTKVEFFVIESFDL